MEDDKLTKRVVNQLVMCTNITEDIGLYHGKMGIVLFLVHYARYTGETSYDDLAGELLDEIFKEIHTNTTIDFESGLCGIGWGIEYLLENNFVEGNSDEILAELDLKVMQKDIRRITDMSIKTGIEGISYYISKRINISQKNKVQLPFDNIYLSDWRSVCKSSYPSDKEILAKIMEKIPDNDNILEWEFGLENGCAGWGLKKII